MLSLEVFRHHYQTYLKKPFNLQFAQGFEWHSEATNGDTDNVRRCEAEGEELCNLHQS